MAKIIDDIYAKITGRQKERHVASLNDIRALVIFIGDSERGNGDLEEIDLNHYAAVLEREGFKPADVRFNVERYKARCRNAELAAEADALREKSEALEKKFRAFDAAEGERQRLARRELESIEIEMRRAIDKFSEAAGAVGELIAGSVVTDEEHELTATDLKLVKRVREIEAMLNPNAPRPFPGGGCYMIGVNPAAMCKEARADLQKVGVNDPHERRAKIQATLRLAEARCGELDVELASLNKERAKIRSRLEVLTAAKCAPKNFPMRKARLSADEERKLHGLKSGLGDGPDWWCSRG